MVRTKKATKRSRRRRDTTKGYLRSFKRFCTEIAIVGDSDTVSDLQKRRNPMIGKKKKDSGTGTESVNALNLFCFGVSKVRSR